MTTTPSMDADVDAGRMDADVDAGRMDADAGRMDADVDAGRMDADVDVGRMYTDVDAGRMDADVLYTDVDAGRTDTNVLRTDADASNMDTDSPLLEAVSISKRFAGLQAVGGPGSEAGGPTREPGGSHRGADGLHTEAGGLSFTVNRGSFVGLIGPNGAGKSTIFNLISGVLASDTGFVTFDGHDITNARSDTIAELGIGRTFQTPRAFESLSVLDNVVSGATSPAEKLRAAFGRAWRSHEADTMDAAGAVLERVGLSGRAADSIADLSGGELRMLEVARQLVRKPTLLLLDEPTAGVHPSLQERLAALLADLHAEGMTLVVVEHNLHFLLALAEHILVLAGGALLTEGPPSAVRSDPAVISAYLGDEHAA